MARGTSAPAPNGCRRFRFVPDPRKPPEGWLYVVDLDGCLWQQGVSATRLQSWILRARPRQKMPRGKP
jgi:hypothetical protein